LDALFCDADQEASSYPPRVPLPIAIAIVAVRGPFHTGGLNFAAAYDRPHSPFHQSREVGPSLQRAARARDWRMSPILCPTPGTGQTAPGQLPPITAMQTDPPPDEIVAKPVVGLERADSEPALNARQAVLRRSMPHGSGRLEGVGRDIGRRDRGRPDPAEDLSG
jgi:hypothetical protein